MAQSFTNFFNAEGMKDMMNPQNFMQYFNAFDMSKMTSNMKNNAESMNEVSTLAIENAQSMFRRSTEMVQDNAKQMFKAMQDIAGSSTPEQAIARQQRFVQDFMQETASNLKEMLDIVLKSSSEVCSKSAKASEGVMACAQVAPKATKKN